ncbi:MAG: hypothetical protein IIZ56_04040, partial [Clostridia bacterium]|nr:hypothetical protein [Clostridia bacterium]
MKFTERARAFIGDLLDGIACRLSTAGKYIGKHVVPFSIAAAALTATIVLLCIFVPKLSDAANTDNKEASALASDAILIPTLPPTPTPTATPTPSPTPVPTPTPEPLLLEKGVRNDIVIDVQQRLMELNYMDYDEPT